MLDRREFLRSWAFNAVAAAGCSICGSTSRAQSRTAKAPCILAEAAFRKVQFEAASSANQIEGVRTFRGTIIQTSGSEQFDMALGRAVLAPLAREFKVTPGFGYYNENVVHGPGEVNAMASNVLRVPQTEGTVVYGLNMLKANLRHKGGDFAVMATCAHEFGHIKQYQTGAFQKIAAAGLPKYTQELQADFLAGYFVRVFYERVPETNLQEIGRDHATSGHPTNPGSHGTSAMRIRALEAGFDYAKRDQSRNIDKALTASYQHIAQYRG
jgi:hypothetical protein